MDFKDRKPTTQLDNMELRLVRMETRLVKYQEQNMLEASELREHLSFIVDALIEMEKRNAS